MTDDKKAVRPCRLSSAARKTSFASFRRRSPETDAGEAIHARSLLSVVRFRSSLAWWRLQGDKTRSHPDLGRQTPSRRWYSVSRHGRVGRRQARKERILTQKALPLHLTISEPTIGRPRRGFLRATLGENLSPKHKQSLPLSCAKGAHVVKQGVAAPN